MRAITWFKELGLKRKLALVLAPGVAAIGLDAGIAHFAGRPAHHPAQLAPVLFAPVAVALLGWAGHAALGEVALRRVLRAVGALGIFVGGAGTAFHLLALARLMEAPFRVSDLAAALAVAPPLFAPGAFAGLGALIWVLGNPRLELAIHDAPATLAAPLHPAL